MKNRIIFLDYDGVLNDPAYLVAKKKGDSSLDPLKIILLSRICKIANAKVVLTSSWRNNKDAESELERAGITVVGTAPHLMGATRADEIGAWIRAHNFKGDFVIIDDEDDGLHDTYPMNFVNTKALGCPRYWDGENIATAPKYIGLRDEHVLLILETLKVGQ